VVVHELDLRIGGGYRISMITPEEKAYTVYGRYLEISPPSRLSFTWQWDNEPDSHDSGNSVIRLEFEASPGGCEQVLRHERLPTEQARDSHAKGWTGCLGQLDRYLT
jgi:uncharacterized protein YndB with AHSA1/START domain